MTWHVSLEQYHPYADPGQPIIADVRWVALRNATGGLLVVGENR